MDERLKLALDFSNFRQAFTIQHKILKEKNQAKLTYGHNGGVFYIDRELICFTQFLIDKGRTTSVVLMDKNDNPVIIEDLCKFQDEILDRYFASTNEYFESYQKIKKSRSIEKLLDL
ncbi:MAG: hypothetical protein EBV15_06770 [Bacteroidetes bacterium]|nr:hypothetical protein [Bacteroidota bacterium]